MLTSDTPKRASGPQSGVTALPDVAAMVAAPTGTRYTAAVDKAEHDPDTRSASSTWHLWEKRADGRWHKGTSDKTGWTAESIRDGLADAVRRGLVVHESRFGDIPTVAERMAGAGPLMK
jgi:hypothetical protein